MAFCRCFHTDRKAVVLCEDGFLLWKAGAEIISRGQAAGVLISGGICTKCIVRHGTRPRQVTTVQQHALLYCLGQIDASHLVVTSRMQLSI